MHSDPLSADDLKVLKLSLQIFKSALSSNDNPALIPCIFYGTHTSKPWSVFVRGLHGYPSPNDLDQIDNILWTENGENAIDDAARFRISVRFKSQTYTIFFSDQVRSFFFGFFCL
jgi:hypothetical protein